MVAVVASRLKKDPVVTETPAHKQGHSLLMRTELRRRRMKLGPTDVVIAESPMKSELDAVVPSLLPSTSQFMRRSSFYSEKPSRNLSKYARLEERMTQKVLSPPSQKFNSTYVAGSWLTSPRRITPKALFSSLLSPSPTDKASTNLPRRLNLKSPVRNVGARALLDFYSPVKTAVPVTSAGVVASPPRSIASGFDLDSPSRNTRSHVYSGKHVMQPETADSQQAETLASPSSLGNQNSRLMSPLRVPVSSPDAKRHGHFAKSSEISIGRSFQSFDVAVNQMPEPVISSSRIRRVHLTKCGNAVEVSSDASGVVANLPDHSSCSVEKTSDEGRESGKRLPKKKPLSFHQSLPLTTTQSFSAESAQPPELSVEEAEGICNSNGIKSLSGTSDPGMSRKRKKSAEDVTCKSMTRKRPLRQFHPISPSTEQCLSTAATADDDMMLTTLSIGCDVESDAAVIGQNEKVPSDALWHLGSSGIESESSSNDVDLMITRKNLLLNRKCSSGFQSLGHISETEDYPSPVFGTISNVAKVSQSDQHPASVSASASPVFAMKPVRSLAGDSPGLSLSGGSGRKRTPVPICSESFSPEVSQHSIAHLITSPLLEAAETQQKFVGRNRPSTRRCLDPQMCQSSKRLSSASRHSSAKPTNDDN